ncbi:hypothetical protein ACFWNR_06940 [Streptomyces virginiae]|uniref:hypothetical protein n=1 Tax=Streptomyces virginiae TaxID=1961 RepID=UPI003660881F
MPDGPAVIGPSGDAGTAAETEGLSDAEPEPVTVVLGAADESGPVHAGTGGNDVVCLSERVAHHAHDTTAVSTTTEAPTMTRRPAFRPGPPARPVGRATVTVPRS